MPYARINASTSSIAPFSIDIPDEDIADLRERLQRARWPDQVGPDWAYGIPLAYLQSLCRYWQKGFDWRHWERRLNTFDQFRIQYEDVHYHFIHQRSPHSHAAPLVITHGWPGSVLEFHKIIEPLTEPDKHGGNIEDAFHVICPSIPGFGFSSAPTQPGFETRAASRFTLRLMEDLGYERFFIQGGDLGAGIALKTGRLGQDRVLGIHLNMALVFPPKEDPMRGVTEEEKALLDRFKKRQPDEGGYGSIQSTKPQTLGYGLHDSPVGQAAWIAEKFHGWTDHDGDFEQAVSRDELLANISIYWFTGTATSSARYYYECSHFDESGAEDPPTIPAPVAFALFPADLMHPPRAWAERQFNVCRWTRFEKGGHFAALERPHDLVEDIRAAFRPLRR